MTNQFEKFDSMSLQSLEYKLYSNFVEIVADEKSRNEYFNYLLTNNPILYNAFNHSVKFLPKEATEAQILKLMIIILHHYNKPQS